MGDRDRPEVEYAWAAGFLDGDGCFGFHLSNPGHEDWKRYPLVSAAQTSRIPLERLAELLGGKVRFLKKAKGNEREAWIWDLRGAALARSPIDLVIPTW